eukprot:224963_1
MSEEDDLKSPTASSKLRNASSNSRHKTEYDDDIGDEEYSASRSSEEGEWIECKELASGRHLFYNSVTFEIVFDDDPSAPIKDQKQKPKQASSSGEFANIASDDIAD